MTHEPPDAHEVHSAAENSGGRRARGIQGRTQNSDARSLTREGASLQILRMPSPPPSLRALYRSWPTPMAAALLNVGMLGIALVGLFVDPRIVTDAPVWLKPAKFATSVPFFLVFLAWMMKDVPPTRGLRRALSLISWILTIEVALIFVQAARGTTSHFNVDTPLGAAIFSTMGSGIAIVWLCSMFVLWVHWRAPAPDRTLAIMSSSSTWTIMSVDARSCPIRRPRRWN